MTCCNTISEVIYNNHPECLESLLKSNESIGSKMQYMTKLISGDMLLLLDVLHKYDKLPKEALFVNTAAGKGKLEILKRLFANDSTFLVNAIEAAAKNGFIECIRYLHEHVGVPLSEKACNDAAMGGHHECLEYLLGHGCTIPLLLFRDIKQTKYNECKIIVKKYDNNWFYFLYLYFFYILNILKVIYNVLINPPDGRRHLRHTIRSYWKLLPGYRFFRGQWDKIHLRWDKIRGT